MVVAVWDINLRVTIHGSDRLCSRFSNNFHWKRLKYTKSAHRNITFFSFMKNSGPQEKDRRTEVRRKGVW